MVQQLDTSAPDKRSAAAHVAAPTGVPVELRGLRRRFGSVQALAGLDLDLAPGELVVLLGPSGCGKTTALRALAGLEDVDEGTLRVAGLDLTGVPAAKRDMGMVFQAYSLFPHMTARENVEFGLRLRGQGRAERRRAAEEHLELVGLGSAAGRYAHQLSGGQQQRVALARALAIRPRVLLLDEPLSALDAQVRVQLREEIRRIQSEVGITTLFVTHDQEEALAVADRVGVMRDGRLEQIDTPDAIYTRPATPFVASFIGISNSVPGVADAGYVQVLGRSVPLLPGSAVDGRVRVLLRPESIHLVPTAPGAPAGPGDGVVVSTSFLGAFGRTRVELGDGLVLTVHISSDRARHLGPGTSVTASPDSVAALAVPA
ncbi:ABC transporter ATP-binding protein [Nakamurella flavida]|uniref:ABC-type quaternary amine transporter n=1 Tax=Nakamurella flavida TaxID=363630 RepID=A0A938YKJ9_9ACTN|nr:ABC transporter ATP-binding protein [Nakamurella flavida]MBM9477682.1 ABC transporter ATP-binding protein [Nakamurella flavida]MDP9779234.1 putative spermidine/putrescine transport system ATP-binding protein [Nakamurella flavida]